MKWKNGFGYSRRRWLLHCPLVKRYWFVFQPKVQKGGDVDVASKKCEKCLTADEFNGCCSIRVVNFNLSKDSVTFLSHLLTQIEPKITLSNPVRAEIVHKRSQCHVVAVRPIILGCCSCIISFSSSQEATSSISVCQSRAAAVISFIISDTFQLIMLQRFC